VTDNGDGTKKIACQDGTTVTVSDGKAGTPCTVTDNGDGTKTISCSDGTKVTVSDGQSAVSVATVTVHLTDADSRADIVGAQVVASPGGVSATTDSSGQAKFANLPVGVYQFTASASGLKLVGATVAADATQTTTTDPISVVGGTTVSIESQLRRLDRETLNLLALHSAGNAGYTVANCKACHNDRKNELSADATKPPFHALKTHASADCTTCHQTVDLALSSGAFIRKQVNVALCKGCHLAYPASF
jgi:hypothetical protein